MSARLYSTIGQSYAQILPDARSYNTITNPVFIKNDGNPLSADSGGVAIAGDLSVSGVAEFNGIVAINAGAIQSGSALFQHNISVGGGGTDVWTSYNTNLSTAVAQASYQLYNGNVQGSGINQSTLQMYAYDPAIGGASAKEVFQINPNGSVYVPSAKISSINSTSPFPVVNTGTTSTGLPYPNLSNVALSTFVDGNPDGTQCLVSGQFLINNNGNVSPGANDYLVMAIYGGSGFTGGIYHTIPLNSYAGLTTPTVTLWSLPVTGYITKNGGSNIVWGVFGDVTNSNLTVSVINPTFQALYN